MSAVVVFAPVVVMAAWPMVSAAAATIMAALGYAVVSASIDATVKTKEKLNVNARETVELELENCQAVGETLTRAEELVFTKNGIVVTFKRDIRGRLQVCVSGNGMTKAQLRELGEKLAEKVIQQYVYSRVVSELEQTDMKIIDQEVDEDETIRIKLRAWD